MITHAQYRELLMPFKWWGMACHESTWLPDQVTHPQVFGFAALGDDPAEARDRWADLLAAHVAAGRLTRDEADRITSAAETFGSIRTDDGRAHAEGEHATEYYLELDDLGDEALRVLVDLLLSYVDPATVPAAENETTPTRHG